MKNELFLYLLIFVFTLGQFGRFPFGGGVVLHAADLLLFMITGIWLCRRVTTKKLPDAIRHPFLKPVLIFTVCCIISLLVSIPNYRMEELLIASMYLIRWVSYALTFFVFASVSKTTGKKLLSVLILSQGVFILAGFIQYFYYPNLRNVYYLGWDDHLYRLFSTFLDPNFAASQINLSLFLVLGLLITRNREIIRNRIVLSGFFLFGLIAMLLTYSRSGYLMFAAGISVLFWLYGKKKLIVIFLMVLAAGILLLPKDLKSSGVELWRTASITARSESMRQAVTIFQDHPVFGTGFNTYRYAMRNYGFVKKDTWEENHAGAGTDNSFLFVLATTGITGLCAYMYLWYSVIRYLIRLLKQRSSKASVAAMLPSVALASITGLFINSFFINSLFYMNILFWFWLIMGLTDSGER